MALTDETIEALLPQGIAPLRVPGGGDVEGPARRLQDLGEGTRRRTFLWSLALQSLVERDGLGDAVPGFEGSTYGFVPVGDMTAVPETVKHIDGYVFGMAFEIESRAESARQEVVALVVENQSVACVFNRRRPILHVTNVASPVGTGACWARSKKTRITPAADGIITAGHVVAALSRGSSVSMDDGTYWTLGDYGSCRIDAALIVQAGSIPGGVSALQVQNSPVGGTDVAFSGVGTGKTVTAKITHTVVHPTYYSDRHLCMANC
jgi:hypothetical protein